jgi:pimeloyl-ACP methyl ester carboxylesterase
LSTKTAKVPESVPVHDQSALGHWGFFHVGGHYEAETEHVLARGESDPLVMRGQMYVEVFVPKCVTQPYPVVLIHCNNQTGLMWMGTPDGRKGWTQYYVEQGYIVYVVDAPSRGRASFLPKTEDRPKVFSAHFVEQLFSNASDPQHTQFPGEGKPGDPAFDAFCASLNPTLPDAKMQRYFRDAGVTLLDRIGEAILFGHSQSGSFAWLLADTRPDLVKGIVVLDPGGPPFRDGGVPEDRLESWGLSLIPLTYDPPVAHFSEFRLKRCEPEKEGQTYGFLQQEPARQLPKLKNIPILIVSGAASYHAGYDHFTSLYLKQAGVDNTYVNLTDIGVYGNGHMMMLEKNNLEIATYINQWLRNRVSAPVSVSE